MTRRLSILIVISAVLAVLLVVHVRHDSRTNQNTATTAGGRLIATFRREPKSFDRLVSANAAESLIALLTQATLVRVNRTTGALEPRLAESWTSADNQTYTIKLRDAVRFSDGHPFTAADVIFTFRALYDPHVSSPMASGFMIAGEPITVRLADDYTILLSFPSPYGPGLAILDSLPILPAHKLEASLDQGTFADAWNVKTPPAEVVGLGPFALAEYRSGEYLRFTRNPHFWQADANGRRLPYLDQIDVQIVPERNAEMLRLESGDVDLINDFARAEDLAALKQGEERGQLRLVGAGVDINPNTLWFNLTPGAKHAKGRPWLQSEELRRAISFAVDRQRIVDTVYLGEAVPIYGPITPGHKEWYVPDLPRTEHDPNRAKALLASIGLVDRNGDGMLDDANGKPVRFSVLTQKGDTIRERTMAVVLEELKQIGIGVDIIPTDPNAIVAQLGKGDYDAIYFSAFSDSIDPARNLDYWMSSGFFHF